MSTKISLILFVLLALFVAACSPAVATDPAPVASTNQENTSIIPVTGENISEASSNEAISADDVSAPISNVDEKQIQQSDCILDGDQPRHIGGCVDFYSPDLNVDKKIPDPCTSEDDQPHHLNGCDG